VTRRSSSAGALLLATCALGASAQTPHGRKVEFDLTSRVFGNARRLHVLLPPGYDEASERQRRYPAFYFCDGIAAFDAQGWGLPAVAETLFSRGEIPPTIFVGIDNGGSTTTTREAERDRASEYLPYLDQSWTESPAPRPRGKRFPDFLFNEVVPAVAARFRVRTDPSSTGLAGESYAGAAVLYTALARPGRIGALLVESPSLHLGEGRLLADAAAARSWPQAVYLGVGTAEGRTPADQAEMLANVRSLAAAIRARSPETRLHLLVQPEGVHWFGAWRARLPEALRFLLGPSRPAAGPEAP
jgi:enterochelin esterase-like enzyme